MYYVLFCSDLICSALLIDVFIRVERAYIPELGLSNKAADLMSGQEQLEMVTCLYAKAAFLIITFCCL